MLGDFNCVCAPEDRSNRARVRDHSAILLNDIVAENLLEDVASVSSKRSVPFTHFQGQSHARLDRAYISLDLVPLCSDYLVQPVSFSDHALVMFALGRKVKVPQWNWSLWKLNSCLLKDEVFKSKVDALFKELYEDKQTVWGVRWEFFKEGVKMAAIERSTILSKQRKQKEKELRRQLNILLIEESAKPGEFVDEIRSIKD